MTVGELIQELQQYDPNAILVNTKSSNDIVVYTDKKPTICNCYNHGYCNGTREVDPCTCSGNMLKCDFYPHVRAKVKRNTVGIEVI